MSNKFKDISIKNPTFDFFDDIINIKICDPNDIKIDESQQKYSDLLHRIYDDRDIDSKYVKINSVIRLYLYTFSPK